jgi:hypothetical protein
VVDVPDGLTLARHRDLAGRERRPWIRWTLLSILGLLCVLGLANAFGQRPDAQVVESAAARLEILSPTRLRSGLYFESRFTVEARRELREATLVLDRGWLEGMTLNTLAPSPVGEASRDGRIALELGHIPRGDRHVLFLHFQVNPTNTGRRPADVELHDGETRLLRADRDVTIFP